MTDQEARKKRYIVVKAARGWGDWAEIDLAGACDDWLDAIKMMRNGSYYIVDTETGALFDRDDDIVIKARKDFAWYMARD